MKKNLVLMGLGLISVLCLIVSVSAGVYFSQPAAYYNIGDTIEVQVEVAPITEGFLKVDLICSSAINVFSGIPSEGKMTIKFPLTQSYIKDNSGQCYFQGEYAGETQKSLNFEISKLLDVRLNSEIVSAKPGEDITISGTANRLNGIGVNGDVEVSIPLLKLASENPSDNTTTNETYNETQTQSVDTKFSGKVDNGTFTINFKLNDNTPAGEYSVSVEAYEKDTFDRITSEGLAMSSLRVIQVPTSLKVAINDLSIDPGNVLEIRPLLNDQTNGLMEEDVSMVIENQNLERVFEKIVKSGETYTYNVPTNITAGYYDLQVSYENLSESKRFFINEKAIASFEVKNNTLIVTNIGNIPYNRDIEVEMNGKPFVRRVNLGLGESQEFRLTGDGSFDIRVSDGESETSQSGVALTGNAVNVQAVRTGLAAMSTPIVWIFFIVVIGAGLLFLFRNILKKKSFAYPIKDGFSRKIENIKSNKPIVIEKAEGKMALYAVTKAEQALIQGGVKNQAGILVIKIKNALTKDSRKVLEDNLEEIYNKKGATYEKDGQIIAIFSPLVTKTTKNEINAVRAAEVIKKDLMEHNKKFADKIIFGFGVNSGEIINKVEDKKLKYTPLGNLIPATKKTAEVSKGEILLTKEAAAKAQSEIKCNKRPDGYFGINRIVDSEKNNEFINKFMKRSGMEKK